MHFYFTNTSYEYIQMIDFVRFDFCRGVGGIVVNMD